MSGGEAVVELLEAHPEAEVVLPPPKIRLK